MSMTRFKQFLISIASEFQSTENNLATLGNDFNIDSATGALLDLFGADALAYRPDRFTNTTHANYDIQYRQYIKSLWAIYRSSGSAQDILTVAQQSTGATIIRLLEPGLASDGSVGVPGIVIYCNSNINGNIDLLNTVEDVGISCEVVFNNTPHPLSGKVSDNPSDTMGPLIDNGLGLSERNASLSWPAMFWTGGKISERIINPMNAQ